MIKQDIEEREIWSEWKKMPPPDLCREITGPACAGVYQVRNHKTLENILFGIGSKCQARMKSLYPKPYGTGTRNNAAKRSFILENWAELEYRTIATKNRESAKAIEGRLRIFHGVLLSEASSSNIICCSNLTEVNLVL
jgi:hypothetical protein